MVNLFLEEIQFWGTRGLHLTIHHRTYPEKLKRTLSIVTISGCLVRAARRERVKGRVLCMTEGAVSAAGTFYSPIDVIW